MAKKSKVRVKYAKKFLVLIADDGAEYEIEPLYATGSRFACRYRDIEIEFEIGKIGYAVKSDGLFIPSSLYNLLVAFSEVQMRTTFRGYGITVVKKIEVSPQLELFE